MALASAAASPQQVTINSTNAPHLRVGLKWDPKEIDHLKFYTKSKTAKGAYVQIAMELGVEALYNTAYSTFMRRVKHDPVAIKNFAADDSALAKLEKMREDHPDEFKGPSYNLDLLCFKYDAKKKLLGLISPDSVIAKNPNKAELSILHSGDDPDGVGVGFDEELLVTLADIPSEVATIFFVISSDNYGFSKIKGGACAIIRTQDETELLHGSFEAGGETETMVFAAMRRSGDGWTLDKIAKFVNIDEDKKSPLDDSVDDILRNQFL